MNRCSLLCLAVLFLLPVYSLGGCDRSRSRLVRRIVFEKIMPVFSALNVDLSDNCLFSPARDRYREQEAHKSIEEGTRWLCHFCGKAFVSEFFLDRHFDNRHTDKVQDENSVCLADVCEVFRCDVIGRVVTPDYWDLALCLEDDMTSLFTQCEELVKSCIPDGLTANETQYLTNITIFELCSYLTCAKYWEIPFESEGKVGMVGLYIMLSVMIFMGMFIYYCIFYSYFYTDAFSDSISYEPSPRIRHSIKPFQPDLRQRNPAFWDS